MCLFKKMRVLLLAFLIVPALGQAAVQHIIEGGKLTGAEGILINQVSYDVSFKDGSFNDLFQGVIPAFHSERTVADQFTQALLDQVFTGVLSIGNIDLVPELTSGCVDNPFDRCDAAIPYSFFGGTTARISVSKAINDSSIGNDSVGGQVFLSNADLSSDQTQTYAVFALSNVAAIPEPSTNAMLLMGLGLLALNVGKCKNLLAKA